MNKGNTKSAANDGRLDPDARFLLANERTFLAWVRTSLAVLVGGIALAQLGHNSTEKNVVGMAVIVLGGFMALVGYLRFRAADKAIREGRLPVTGREPLIQAGGIAIVALALVVTHLLGIW
jgi:putative membrane protein